jgi:hypothetical protein
MYAHQALVVARDHDSSVVTAAGELLLRFLTAGCYCYRGLFVYPLIRSIVAA